MNAGIYTIKINKRLTLFNAISLGNHLWATPMRVERLIFDCSEMQHVEPFSIAYVSTEIRRFIASRPNTIVEFQGYERATFAAHMGFFKAAGVDYGNEPGQARGNSNYIPLTILSVGEIVKEAADAYEPVGNIIERQSEKLAKMLIRDEGGELLDTLTYSLREIMRNVAEHSKSEVLEFCAQYWPTKQRVEMVVVDSGVGVRKSLSNNPFLKIENDRDAIHLALMPAISGKMYKGIRRDRDDVWQNSGFGLYMTNRICRNGGSFFLCSGDSGILLSERGKQDFKTTFVGTALRLAINTRKLVNLTSSLAKYRSEGYELASRHDKNHPIEPSIASTMLFRDFQTKS